MRRWPPSSACTAEKKKFVKLNEEEKKARRNFKRLTAFHPQTRLNGGTQSRHSTAELREHFKRELLETPRLLLVVLSEGACTSLSSRETRARADGVWTENILNVLVT